MTYLRLLAVLFLCFLSLTSAQALESNDGDSDGRVGTPSKQRLVHVVDNSIVVPGISGLIDNIDDSKFVVVSDRISNGALSLTKSLAFSPDLSGNFFTACGEYLQVILVNPDGTDRCHPSPLNHLTLNIQGLASSPAATTYVKLMNTKLPADLTAAPIGSIMTLSCPVTDSTGNIRNLTFSWARVDRTTIGAPATADLFNAINTTSTQAWGLIISGTGATVAAPYAVGSRIEFDGHGNPTAFNTQGSSVGTATPAALAITWAGGTALPSAITLDLGYVGGNTGVVSIGNTFASGFPSKDGYESGFAQSIDFDEHGIGTVTYSNYECIRYCRLPRLTIQ